MLKNDEEWITKDGKKIMVGDMTEEHAKNVLRMLLRRRRDGEDEMEEKELIEMSYNGPFDYWK